MISWNLSAQTCSSERYLSDVFQSSVSQGVVFGESPALTAVYVAENVTVNQDMTMDVFFPVGDDLPKRPLVMLAYGGGFLVGSKEDEDVWATCDSLAKKGYVTASINYRMNMNIASSSSAVRAMYRAAQDYSSAIRFMKENADVYGIDTNYVFVGGVSAGGFSAMHAVFMDDNERPASTFQSGPLGGIPDLGCVNCAGNNYNHSTNVRGIINLWGAVLDTALIQQDEIVPMALFHGTDDLIVPYNYGFPFTALFLMPEVFGSENIANRVNNLGGNAELNTFVGVGHNIWGVNVDNNLVGGPTEHWNPITDSIISFLYENIRPGPPVLDYETPFCDGDTAWLEATNVPQGGWTCWSVEQGEIVYSNSDSSLIGVVWNSPGNHSVSAVSFNHLEALSVTTQTQVSVYISPVVSISDQGGTLLASGNYSSYQWYLNGAPIPGADQQQYSPVAVGTYTVETTASNGCRSFSEPLLIVGLPEYDFTRKAKSVSLLDATGRLLGIFNSIDEISTSTLPNGIYVLQFFDEKNNLIGLEKTVITSPF